MDSNYLFYKKLRNLLTLSIPDHEEYLTPLVLYGLIVNIRYEV